MLDPSSFTLAPNGGGGGGAKTPSPTRNSSSMAAAVGGNHYVVQDSRWKFITEDKFPKPREFVGGPKKYRAGRGSSVPLDLNALG